MEEFLKLSFGDNISLPLIMIVTIVTYSFYFQLFMIVLVIIEPFLDLKNNKFLSKKCLFPIIKELFIFVVFMINNSSVKKNIFPIISFLVFARFLLYSCNFIVEVIPKNKTALLISLITFSTLIITFFKEFKF